MYCAQATRFLAFVAKPLVLVRLGDVQADLATLDGPAPATRADATTLKSLFSFAQETGDLRFNLGKVPEAPPVKSTPAERILAESDALLMVRLEPNMSQAECRTSNEGRLVAIVLRKAQANAIRLGLAARLPRRCRRVFHMLQAGTEI